MKKYLIYIGLILTVNLPLLSHAKDIADRLIAQYVQQYEALEKFNDENDRNGRSSQNQYIIKLSPDWIEEQPGPGLVILKDNYEDIAELLREFNGSRKDNLRFYVVVSGVFQAYVKQDISILQLPERFENFDIAFKDLLDVKVRNSIFDLLWGNGVDKFRKGVLRALKQKGYTERALYFFSVLQLFTHDGNDRYYSIDNLQLTGELFKYDKEIRSKARQGWVRPDVIKKVDPPDVRVASAVANIITAIAIEYDAGGASRSGIVDCGKDVAAIANETWKGQGTVYNDTIKAFARLLDAPSSKQTFKSEYFIIDKPENFTNTAIRNAILPDVVFNSEILPDKIKLLAAQGKCDYKVYVVFKEVDFAIPDEQRETFARDVQAQSSIASKNTILIVVPYYSCVNNEVHYADYSVEGIQGDAGSYTSRSGYPMYLMPCVYSPDANMMLQMNSALTRQKSFRDGFNQAFKYIPKDYNVIVWAVDWNGDARFEEKAQEEYKKVTGYEDLISIRIIQDTRLDEIYEAYIKRHMDGSDNGGTSQDYYVIKALDAMAFDRDVDVIISKPPHFIVFEGASDLVQSTLTKEVSLQYVLNFVSGKSIKKCKKINEDLFYGKNSPFKGPGIFLTFVDLASLAASPFGFDWVFDGVGLIYSISTGDAGNLIIYEIALATPIVAPTLVRAGYAGLVEGKDLLVKGAKGAYKIVPRKLYGLTFLIKREGEFSHLLRSILHPETFSKVTAFKTELNFIESVEDGLLAEPKAAQAFNDTPELMNDYHAFYNEGKGNVADFFREGRITLGIDEDILKAVSLLKKEDGWVDVIVHGDANNFSLWHNGTRIKLDHRRLLKYMESLGYAKGTPIRLLSCETGKSSLSIAQFLSDKATAVVKAPNVKIGITEPGELVALDGLQGEWKYFKPGQSTAYSATSVEKIRTILPNEKAFKLGIFDEEVVDLLAVSKVLVDPTYEALAKYYKDEKFLSAMEDIIEISSEKTMKEFNDFPQLIDDLYKRFEKLGKDTDAFVQYYAEARRRISLLDQNTSFAQIRKKYLSGEIPQAFKGELTLEEEAVTKYFSDDAGSSELNKALRDGTSLTPYQKALKQTLQDGLAHLPKYEGIVYRGVDIHEAVAINVINLREGGEILYKDFKTATASRETAQQLSKMLSGNRRRYVLAIKSKSATKIRQITGTAEKEVLFQPSTAFKVDHFIIEPTTTVEWVTIHVEEILPGSAIAVRESGVLGPAITQALHELDAVDLEPMVKQLIDDAVKTKNIEKLEELLGLKSIAKDQYIVASNKSYMANVPNTIPDDPDIVALFTATERKQYELSVKNGKLFTKGEQLEEGVIYLYVQAPDGKIYVSKEGILSANQKRIHHSSFLSGENIVTGGELKIEDGTIIINNESGHYFPSQLAVADAMLELIRRGVDGKTLKFKLLY